MLLRMKIQLVLHQGLLGEVALGHLLKLLEHDVSLEISSEFLVHQFMLVAVALLLLNVGDESGLIGVIKLVVLMYPFRLIHFRLLVCGSGRRC
jgi:NhaP-type Na+/H+ or K+/H+ antiporter